MATRIDISQLTPTGAGLLERIRAARIVGRAAFGDQGEDARLAARAERLQSPLAAELDRRLASFQTALRAFDFPEKDIVQTARLLEADPDLAGRVNARLSADGEASRFYKAFSRGFDAAGDHGLEAGTYAFTLTLGDETEELSVSLAEDETSNRELLTNIRDAVNGADLPAQAELIRQTAPDTKVQGLNATGLVLGLTVSPAYADQDLAVDARDRLVRELDFTTASGATTTPIGPATLGRYDLRGPAVANPTEFLSSTFDPDAAGALAAGDYTVGYAIGDNTGSFEVTVAAGDTWDDVLQATARGVNSSQAYFAAETAYTDRPVFLYVDGKLTQLSAQGVRLEVGAQDPKLGQRLALTDTDGLLAAIGVEGTASPGSDGLLEVGSRDFVTATNSQSLDRGRLTLAHAEPFGETLPLKVVQAVGSVEERFLDVVDAYNGLRRFVNRNADFLVPDLGQALRDPIASGDGFTDAARLLGVREAGKDRVLWVDRDTFYQAVVGRTEAARLALTNTDPEAGPLGVVAFWGALTGRLREEGTEAALDPEALTENPFPPLGVQQENREQAALLDVFDAPTTRTRRVDTSLSEALSGPSSGPPSGSWSGSLLNRNS